MTVIERDRLSTGGAEARANGGVTAGSGTSLGWEWLQALSNADDQTVTGMDEAKGSPEGASLQLWKGIGDRLALASLAMASAVEHLGQSAQADETCETGRAMPEHGPSGIENVDHTTALRRHSAIPVRAATALNVGNVDAVDGAVGIEPDHAIAIHRTDLQVHVPISRPASARRAADSGARSALELQLQLPPSAALLPASLRRLMQRRETAFERATKEPNRERARGSSLPVERHRSMRWLKRITHAYAGPDGVTLWLRDARIEVGHLRTVVRALQRWAQTVSVTLAAIVCNGTVIYRNAHCRSAAPAAGSPVRAGNRIG